MTRPSFACPRCGYTTFLPSDVRAGYCPQCRWWTGDSLLGSEDVLAQAEIDGPFVGSIGRPRCSTCGAAADIDICVWEALEPVGYACTAHGEIRGDGSGEPLPNLVYCAEHDLFDCWYAHDPTRAEVETEWFGAPIEYGPTFRVARFVQALRRLRRR